MNLTERYKKKLEVEKRNTWSLNGILVQMEVTNACNHKCIFCPNADSIRKRTMMDFGLACRVMRECADFLKEDKRICFHMNGEPLLYKRLPELIAYSKKLAYEYTFLTTNGSVGDEQLFRQLFDAGLDSIKFSINAGTRETYEKVHGKDDFEKVMSSLKFAWEYREKTKQRYKIFVSCVGIKNNYGELEILDKRVRRYCDEVVFYYPCAYAGQAIGQAEKLYCDLSGLPIQTFEIEHHIPCSVLWNSINITCEGYLSLCCSEADYRLVVEDLHQMSVKDAWMGKKMQEIRAAHLNGKIENMPCYSCISKIDYEENKMDQNLFALALQLRERNKS